MWSTYASCNNCKILAPNPRKVPAEWVTIESRADGSVNKEPLSDPDGMYAHHYHYCPQCVRMAVVMEFHTTKRPSA